MKLDREALSDLLVATVGVLLLVCAAALDWCAR